MMPRRCLFWDSYATSGQWGGVVFREGHVVGMVIDMPTALHVRLTADAHLILGLLTHCFADAESVGPTNVKV